MLNMKVRQLFHDPVLIPSNMLSILRIVLAPVVICLLLMEHRSGDVIYLKLNIAVFLVIIMSDFLDGFFARLLKQETRLGRFLDPLADKVSGLSLVVGLALFKGFPVWLTVFIWVREVSVFIAAYILFSKRDVEVKPNFFGKLCVATGAVSALLFISDYNHYFMGYTVKDISIFFIVLFYILGGIQYVRTYLHDSPAKN